MATRLCHYERGQIPRREIKSRTASQSAKHYETVLISCPCLFSVPMSIISRPSPLQGQPALAIIRQGQKVFSVIRGELLLHHHCLQRDQEPDLPAPGIHSINGTQITDERIRYELIHQFFLTNVELPSTRGFCAPQNPSLVRLFLHLGDCTRESWTSEENISDRASRQIPIIGNRRKQKLLECR